MKKIYVLLVMLLYVTNTAMPYNLPNMKVNYTTDGTILVKKDPTCDGTAPTGITIASTSSTSATLNWNNIADATYQIRYKKTFETNWQQETSSTNSIILINLEEGTLYDLQIATVCSGTPGSYSSTTQFVTSSTVSYCALSSADASEEYISNVTLANVNNTSGSNTYTDYGTDLAKIINLVAESTTNNISVTKAWPADIYPEGVRVWIDFNRDGVFSDSEIVLNSAASTTTTVNATFTVPTTAVKNKTLKMRVAMRYNSLAAACTPYTYGEVEDYNVIVKELITLAANESNNSKDLISLYPNPTSDILNIAKVSNKTSYIIYDNSGRKIKEGNVIDNKVFVEKLAKGAYLIMLNDNGKNISQKFIKK